MPLARRKKKALEFDQVGYCRGLHVRGGTNADAQHPRRCRLLLVLRGTERDGSKGRVSHFRQACQPHGLIMAKSSIEWTESTWNPVTGCTKISAGCKNCYAERMAKRLQAMGQPNYRNGFRLTLHEHAVELPLGWRKPQVVFVNSMSDLFHRDVPLTFLKRVFAVMAEAAQHRFQVLTKRAERLSELATSLAWP